MTRRCIVWFQVAVLCLASLAFVVTAGRSAEPEAPLQAAKRLAASKEKKDRAQALQALKVLAQPGTAPGDEALARYGELCLHSR